MLILHNVSMRVYVRVHVCAERGSVSEDSYENHVRHAGGTQGGKSCPRMNETTLGEEKGGEGGGCEEHNEEKELMR